jgi:glycosyltransferase involved in cell wall biosynthesis
MPDPDPLRVGFVVKRYPRYSETFIVREILAHEAAGVSIDIFVLRPTIDGHFQDLIARVRGAVQYLCFPAEGLMHEKLASATLRANLFWDALLQSASIVPNFWSALASLQDEMAKTKDASQYLYQAAQLACQVHKKGLHHLHAAFASESATVARLAARLSGISYSFTARAKDIFHEKVQIEDLRRKLRDAGGVVTISDYHLQFLRDTFGSLAARVQRIYNGLDLDEFLYQSPRDRPPVIVAIGRLIEKKGFDDLLEACAILAGRGRSFLCQLYGNGPLKADLEAQIDRLGLRSRVELMGPHPQGEIIKAIHNAAVLAMPCVIGKDGDRDGLPNVIQEALALGTPVISTDVTGIPEVVRDGETGLQVPQHDPSALATALERLLGDPDLRVRLATTARRMMESEFDIRRNTERRRAIFRAAVQAAARGARVSAFQETA